MVSGQPTILNLVPSGVMPVVYVSQDDAGYYKQFLIYNGSEPYSVPANVSASVRGKKGDGYGVAEIAEVTAGSNLVQVMVTEQMCAVAGDKNIFELVFTDTDGLRIATVNFVWSVKADALGGAVVSDSDIAYAEQVLSQLGQFSAFKQQLDANTARIETVAVDTEAGIMSVQSDVETVASDLDSFKSAVYNGWKILQLRLENVTIAANATITLTAPVRPVAVGYTPVAIQSAASAATASMSPVVFYNMSIYRDGSGNNRFEMRVKNPSSTSYTINLVLRVLAISNDIMDASMIDNVIDITPDPY